MEKTLSEEVLGNPGVPDGLAMVPLGVSAALLCSVNGYMTLVPRNKPVTGFWNNEGDCSCFQEVPANGSGMICRKVTIILSIM